MNKNQISSQNQHNMCDWKQKIKQVMGQLVRTSQPSNQDLTVKKIYVFQNQGDDHKLRQDFQSFDFCYFKSNLIFSFYFCQKNGEF